METEGTDAVAVQKILKTLPISVSPYPFECPKLTERLQPKTLVNTPSQMVDYKTKEKRNHEYLKKLQNAQSTAMQNLICYADWKEI